MGLFSPKPRSTTRETSKQINDRYIRECPGHEYGGGDQITPTTVRFWCACGAFQDVEDRAVPHR